MLKKLIRRSQVFRLTDSCFRVFVFSCSLIGARSLHYRMNVTLKIDDQLLKEARHRAVDEGLSLSAWMARVVHRELSASGKSPSLLESLGNETLAEIDFDFPRSPSLPRETNFS